MPKWLDIAYGEIGVKEIQGEEDNPRILEYHSTCLLHATSDEISWCSAFVNWCILKAGMEPTRSAAARSWLTWGRPLAIPEPGAIAVFQRGSSSWQGHVGFFLAYEGRGIKILGGNQSDQVKISVYPTAQLLGYRWPTGEPERLNPIGI